MFNLIISLIKVDNNKDFEWLKNLRFYFDPKQPDVLKQLSIHMANAKFQYGFEYLGVQEKLVQTPLNDRYDHSQYGTVFTDISAAGVTSP